MMKRFRNKYEVNPYIRFDDRLLILVGLPVVALFAAMIFAELPFTLFVDNFWHFYIESMVFTSAYWVFNRFLMVFLRKKFPTIQTTLKRNVLQIGVAFLVYPIISIVVHYVLSYISLTACTIDINHSKSLLGLLTTYFLTFLIIAIYEAVYFFKQYKEVLTSQERIKTEHVSSQLTSLRNQVNPHFLFNSLNTLMSLIPREAEQANQYLSKLSSFYRYTVSERDELMVPLQKELDMVKLYADLISERFGDAIKVIIAIEETQEMYVLPMTLQMLVENAVKHNIVSKESPLRIRLYKLENYLHVDNVIQERITETESTGMGLKNIKERYSYVTDNPVIINNKNGLFDVAIPLVKR